MKASKEMQEYFESLNAETKKAYDLARKAKEPHDKIEIPLVKNMAERVEGLIGVVAPQIIGKGLPDRIDELEKEFGKLDWRVAFKIAEEVSFEKFCKFENKLKAMEVSLRVALAYLTSGVVASPLEGFVRLELKKRRDGENYFALFFSGPIRSAGGTASTIFVAVADYIRRKHNYSVYDPDENEIKRVVSELYDYHERITNLQYLPSSEELEFYMKNLPVEIDGDASEKIEVSNYKDLDRVSTNFLRSGVSLVIAEGLTQKSKKFWTKFSGWNKEFDMKDWKWLDKFIDLQTKIRSKKTIKEIEKKDKGKISPDYNFIKDIVAGRPVLTYPLRKGGFRLRYGRGRNSGLSSMALHPVTMAILNDYIAIGTQLKVERPGKGTALGVNDSLEGPIVKLKNGDVLFLDSRELAEKNKDNIKEILFLGDILINYGDFFVYGHSLVPPGYCEEWWIKELEEKANEEVVSEKTGIDLPLLKKLYSFPIKTQISFDQAYNISKKFDIPLHPRFTYHWKDINHKEFLTLIDWLNKAVIKKDDYKIIFPLSYNVEEIDINPKRILELLGIPCKVVTNEYVVIEKDWAKSFMASLGFYENEPKLKEIVKSVNVEKDILEIINIISEIKLKDKSGVYIGARMGRPEKAKMRKLTGSPHVLFPIGEEGGRLRCFQSALNVGKVTAEFPNFYCEKCDSDTIYSICEKCGDKTKLKDEDVSYKSTKLDINYYVEKAKERLGLNGMPDLVKGIRGTSNKGHITENLAKGILRATYNLFVNKDGTIRYDMTELPITHFRPFEIGTDIEKLKELGYKKDIYEEDLVDNKQILEIKPQDVILPSCKEADQEGADVVLLKVANFIDGLLERYYNVDKFYDLKEKKDLVGHLIIGLAPHTSAGILGRIIGFSNTQGCYAHPYWHCAQRRDCDGDENCVMLLMDGLLNFSRKFLPAHRGAVQDAPLLLTANLIPSEVDDMVFDMDCVWKYPLEFYRACEQYKKPWEVDIERVGKRMETERQYEKFGFTHDVSDINLGVRYSAYKSLPTMEKKVNGQMDLAEKIRAVDENDVARLVIERHFIRDIKGNLRKFSMQQFRCVGCNEKYRRVPLAGKCRKCGGKIIFTISEGSVTKYLVPSLKLAKKYKLPSYMAQTLDLVKKRIDSVFGKDPERQEGLDRWSS
jgi:DNA polymerase II large subunit